MVQKLNPDERKSALTKLKGWTEVGGRDAIAKTFVFKDFSQAFGFMTRVALVAEKMDHHPELFNVSDRVEIILRTDEVDGLSERDIAFARAVDEMAPPRDREPHGP